MDVQNQTPKAIQVENLHKAYGQVKALNGVSLAIQPGEIVGLLGPNGAGKTTLIKILTGYMQPDSGTVHVSGLDVLEQPHDVQSILGYLPENAPLYPELSVQAYLKMMAELRQIPEDHQLARISEAVHAIGLEPYLTRPIAQLSKGYRQRVGIAQAILHQPKLLILDEPTVGLDPTQIVQIRALVKRLAKNSTILFSTHILPEVEALCDRAIILMNGEIRADARLQDLANTTATILVLDEDSPGIVKTLQGLAGVAAVTTVPAAGTPTYRIESDSASLSRQVFQAASQHNWPVKEIRQDVRTLETVFNELAMGQPAAELESELFEA